MPDKDAGTPRVFLVRHGETEWTISGRYTGRTDIPLTAHGENQVYSSSQVIVGHGKLIDPSKLASILISPRSRARRTYELLFDGATQLDLASRVETAEGIREWDYGLYEGLVPGQVKEMRKKKGLDLDRQWDIWLDGCESGETPQEMTERLDLLIARIRKIQEPCMHGERSADVVIIAHGHSLRAFAKRWVGFELGTRLPMMLEPGAVGVLSYEHHKVDEPAFLLGVNMGVGELEEEKEQVWRYHAGEDASKEAEK